MHASANLHAFCLHVGFQLPAAAVSLSYMTTCVEVLVSHDYKKYFPLCGVSV